MIVRLVLSGSRAASRDLDGNILIWDLNDALTQNYNHEGNLLRSIVIWYDRNHYFGFGPIPISDIPKPKLVDGFGRYRNRYRNHISKGKSSYQ